MQRIVLLLTFFIPLLSRNCFGAVSESNEIGKLLKNKQPVMFEVTIPCIQKCCKVVELHVRGGIKEYFASETCQISNSAPGEEPPRIMVHGDGERNPNIGKPSLPKNLEFRAMFLRQLPNTVSYMILDHNNAHWFFTNELSGCDIFIATKASQPNKPMVFHANMDDLYKPGEQVDNLKWKGDKVDAILLTDRVMKMGYVLKVRLHISPANPIPHNYKKYWKDYKAAHKGVKVYTYDFNEKLLSPQTQFYGYYKKSWKFFKKAKENGNMEDIRV